LIEPSGRGAEMQGATVTAGTAVNRTAARRIRRKDRSIINRVRLYSVPNAFTRNPRVFEVSDFSFARIRREAYLAGAIEPAMHSEEMPATKIVTELSFYEMIHSHI
jgi:hypothetical protein